MYKHIETNFTLLSKYAMLIKIKLIGVNSIKLLLLLELYETLQTHLAKIKMP